MAGQNVRAGGGQAGQALRMAAVRTCEQIGGVNAAERRSQRRQTYSERSLKQTQHRLRRSASLNWCARSGQTLDLLARLGGRQRPKAARPAKLRLRSQLLLDSQELVELRDAFAAAPGAGLDVTRACRHGQIGDERVFGFAGTVRHEAAVVVARGKLNRIQGFRHRADLVELDEDGVGDSLVDSFLQDLAGSCRRCRRRPARFAIQGPR